MSMLIFSRNFTSPSVVANAYVSSADSDYPVANVYDTERRRRSWRSAGFFEVVDGENVIVFRESVGVSLSAVISPASYASDSLFFAAIKAALEAAGASSYTVTRDTTTDRIKITSNGLGGGGVFQLMLTDPASADMAALLGFSTASDLTGALTYEADLLRLHSSEWLLWDLGVPANPTGLIGLIDRNSVLSFSGGAVIKLQGNETNEWSAPSFEGTVAVSDSSLSLLSSAGFHTGPLRYWRLYFEDKANADGYIELGALCLGLHTTVTRGCAVFPMNTDFQDRSNVVFSENGRTIAGQKAKYQKYTLDWAGLDKASFEALWRVWENFGLHTSFFMALDPSEAFSTDSGLWCKLLKFDAAPSSTLVSPGNWSMEWPLREEL